MNLEQSKEAISKLIAGLAAPDSADIVFLTTGNRGKLVSALQHLVESAVTAPSSDLATDTVVRRGARWSDVEDYELVSAYVDGIGVRELAEKHQRTPSAICARLLRFAKIELPAAPSSEAPQQTPKKTRTQRPPKKKPTRKKGGDRIAAPWIVTCTSCNFRRSAAKLFSDIDSKSWREVTKRIEGQVCPNCDVDSLELHKPNFLNNYKYSATKRTNRNFFHKPHCFWMSGVSSLDEIRFKSKTEAQNRGFVRCPSCNP